MQLLFVESLCNNTDISNWDTSNVTNMYGMFFYINLFNFNINTWNISNVTNTSYMFAHINNFLQDNINLDITNVTKCNNMFTSSKPYAAKYNNNIPLPEDTEKIKDWFKENNDKINAINLKNRYGKEIDDFFFNITDIYSTNRIGLHENLLTECNKQSVACKTNVIKEIKKEV